jgi:hypothetical protein
LYRRLGGPQSQSGHRLEEESSVTKEVYNKISVPLRSIVILEGSKKYKH